MEPDESAEWLRKNADSLAEVDELTIQLIDRIATNLRLADAEQIRAIVAARKIVRQEMTMTPVSGQNT
jgi:hypothetical protein